MEVIFSDHSLVKIRSRDIPKELVRETIKTPICIAERKFNNRIRFEPRAGNLIRKDKIFSNMSVEVIKEGEKKFVKMPKEEFDRWKATVEMAEDEKLQKKMRKSRKEYEEGKTERWKEVRDEI